LLIPFSVLRDVTDVSGLLLAQDSDWRLISDTVAFLLTTPSQKYTGLLDLLMATALSSYWRLGPELEPAEQRHFFQR
jgi:hypothetical protein